MGIPDDLVTTVDADVLGDAERRLRDVAGQFEGGEVPLLDTDADLREAAGQVAHLLVDAQDTFLSSWSGVFDLCAQTSGLVAGNMGSLVTDLTAVDIAGGLRL